MSDEDYSSEEERRPGRSQRHRREHDISPNEYDAAAPSSPANHRPDENEGGEEDPMEEVSAKDIAGPQPTKEATKKVRKRTKRVDKITSNMILNQTILDHYHNVRLHD